jgi:hypothetical protein
MLQMLRKSQPTPGDRHINTPLTQISVAHYQGLATEHFVADQVFPAIPSVHQSDLYWEYPRGAFNQNNMRKRAPGAETQKMGYAVNADGSFYCNVWGLHIDVTDQDMGNTDPGLDPFMDATRALTLQALINRDVEWAAAFFASGIWTTQFTGVAAAPVPGTSFLQWSNPASDFLGDMERAKFTVAALVGSAFEPNTLVVDRRTWGFIYNHPQVLQRILYGNNGAPATVSRQAVAALLGLDRVLVSGAVQNTALEGVAAVHDFIVGEGALLCYVAPTPGKFQPSAGYSFNWTGYMGAGSNGSRIRRFRMEPEASDRVEIEQAYGLRKISADLGVFFINPIA